MPTSKESVEIGREAYKEKRWKEAIDAFTDAIDNAELDDDDLYKYYSNRCACQMQLGASGLDAAIARGQHAAMGDVSDLTEDDGTSSPTILHQADAIRFLERARSRR